MASLLTSLTELITPDVTGRVADSLGESETAVTRGLRGGISSVLAGLVNKTDDPGSMQRVFDLATTRSAEFDSASDVAGSITRPPSGIVDSLLSTMFGGRTNEVGNLLARTAGFGKASSGSMILTAVVPLVMKFLGKRIHERSLGVSQFTSLLASQRSQIFDAAPAGLRDILDTTPAARGERVGYDEYRREETYVPPQTSDPPERRSGGWLWPVLGGAAVLALLWAMLGRDRTPQPTTARLDTAVTPPLARVDSPAAARRVDTAAGTVVDAARDLGADVQRSLPGGVSLTVPERGTEARLVDFIEDERRPVNDTTWFNFDRLTFATGSATILPESQDQLNNIASILRAYPDVRLRIGGYTDNTGDSTANVQLSQQRADAVRQALITRGVAAERLAAEGYGAAHPVADNTTEAGRAQNRRIALRVTAK